MIGNIFHTGIKWIKWYKWQFSVVTNKKILHNIRIKDFVWFHIKTNLVLRDHNTSQLFCTSINVKNKKTVQQGWLKNKQAWVDMSLDAAVRVTHPPKTLVHAGALRGPGQTSKMPEIASGMQLAQSVCVMVAMCSSAGPKFQNNNLCWCVQSGYSGSDAGTTNTGGFGRALFSSDTLLFGDYLRIRHRSQ